tara:strand:- start:355 stop:603 length:249 start_codon:yes stop_codon:yes gene_type:complete
MTEIKTVYIFDPENLNISGLGVIDGKEYEFYLDGVDPIWVDIHKHWINNNIDAWDGDKSQSFGTLKSAVDYINKLFEGNLEN